MSVLKPASTATHSSKLQQEVMTPSCSSCSTEPQTSKPRADTVTAHYKRLQQEAMARSMLFHRAVRLTAKVLLSILLSNPDEVVPLLLPHITVDIVLDRDENHKNTFLHWAAELGHRCLTTRCLDLAAHVDATNKYGETALHYVAESGHLEIVQILIQADADRMILGSHGRTALDCARGAGPGDDRSSHPEIVAYLQQ
jgi:ankyrin repeat protein